MLNIVAIIQARMGSTRLPGKVLKKIGPLPLLEYVIRRTTNCKYVKQVVIAIPDSEKDKALKEYLIENQYQYYVGNEIDVLNRYYCAAREFNASYIIRITGDNPFIDFDMMELTIDRLLSKNADYAIVVNIPKGTACEAFTFEALKKANDEAKLSCEREHVTPYIRQNPNKFKILEIEPPNEYYAPNISLTVDTFRDLTLIRYIYKNFNYDYLVRLPKVLAFLRRKRETYERELQEDPN